MSTKQLKYDAFISYRHSPLDMFVAETIHKRLEEFKLPKNISQNRGENDKTKIERIFRDRDELPLTSNLSDQIYIALHNSEFLIVICSPRIKESMWCRQEMNKFIELHGHDKILAVLIEGEPEDSFPDEIIFETVKETDDFGNVIERKIPIEPLAADVRGKNKTEIRKKINEEILRLAAPMFHVNYDDLKQRHRERKIKKIASITSVAAGIFLAFGLYSGYQAFTIKQKNVEIAAQADAILQQNEEISLQAEKIQEQYDSISLREAKDYGTTSMEYWENCEPELAMKYAYMSVTADEDGNELPVTDQGFGALLNCTEAYENGYFLTPCRTEVYDSKVIAMENSPANHYVFTETSRGNLYIYDVETGALTDSISQISVPSIHEKLTVFLNENLIAYPDGDRAIIYDFIEKKIAKTLELELFETLQSISSVSDSNQAVIRSNTRLFLLDLDTLEFEVILDLKEDTCPIKAGYFGGLVVKSFDEYYYAANVSNLEIGNETCTNGIVIYSLKDKEIYSVFPLEDYQYFYSASISKERFCVFGGKKSDYMDYSFITDPYFLSYDIGEKSISWDSYLYGTSSILFNKIYPSVKDEDGNDRIGFFSGSSFFMIDAETGFVSYNENFKNPVVSVVNITDSSNFVLCTENGYVYYFLADMMGYSPRESGFGDTLDFFKWFGNRAFSVDSDGYKVKIWARHKGYRAEEISFDITTIAELSPDMERIYYYDSSTIYGVKRDGLEEIWSVSDVSPSFVIFSNDKIITYDKYDCCKVIDGKTGEVVFDAAELGFNSNVTVSNFDCINNRAILYVDYKEAYMLDLDTMEYEKIFEKNSEVFENNFIISEDGNVIVLKGKNDDKLHMISFGEETALLDIEMTSNMDGVLFDEGKYFLIRFESEMYAVYDTSNGELLFESSEIIGRINHIYPGTADFPYILVTNRGTYFMNTSFETFYRCAHSLSPVPGENCFTLASTSSMWVVPYYNLDMLLEDVKMRMASALHEDM